jgi:integral membrane sensor domain MASE1
MTNKVKAIVGALSFMAVGIGFAAVTAFAAVTTTPIAIPTDLANAAMTLVGQQLTDPGMILLLVVAAGLPLAFWLAHKGIRLVPGAGGR